MSKHWEQNKDATVYVGNIDERFTQELLSELMTQVGPVRQVHMPQDRVSQTHQGYGFVEFDTPGSAEYASKVLNGIRIWGKPIRVNKASADKQKTVDIGAELFINNLDPQVDEKILYDTFSQFGQILRQPNIVRDDNNISKGYGFVSFDSFEASDVAIATMNGQYLLSKAITVEYAYKKDGKGERHGDEAERKLAAEGKKHNIVPEQQTLPPAFHMTAQMGAPAAPPTGPAAAGVPPVIDPSAAMPPAAIPPIAPVGAAIPPAGPYGAIPAGPGPWAARGPLHHPSAVVLWVPAPASHRPRPGSLRGLRPATAALVAPLAGFTPASRIPSRSPRPGPAAHVPWHAATAGRVRRRHSAAGCPDTPARIYAASGAVPPGFGAPPAGFGRR
ncbi:hypothetical protein NEMBOFW57_005964 [Staphylotrichum longicolle]|uniref:RRM domain-containing protein n=1 Tax=Staphylotrichum longicolle TaxID=669026 RepID=A0AAD4I240_9PEZI|nr:hypothetical protein NEMBOFW57_005964 [Staphylotrichum longicolle]